MKRVVALVAVAVLAAASAAPVSASMTRYAYACEQHYVTNYGGTFEFEDGVALLRGATYVSQATGDSLCAGTITITVNFNLDFTDWSGVLWGTAVNDLATGDGGFEMSWTAHWLVDDPLAATADIWDGRYVGHGFGDMSGWQIRGTLHEASHVLVLDEGFAFRPGS